jgi:pimeloyl-ACP methyl ester carboxylesterase
MESVRAWVHCGARQMAYARAGSGRTLVLLTEWTSEAPVPAIFEALTGSFRVILPELSTGTGCGCGVVDLLDTLGVSRVSLIADAAFAADALQAARTEPERIERVALITPQLGGEVPLSLKVVTMDAEPTPEQIEALMEFVNA